MPLREHHRNCIEKQSYRPLRSVGKQLGFTKPKGGSGESFWATGGNWGQGLFPTWGIWGW